MIVSCLLTLVFCFSFDKLLEMLEYLIDNIYIVVGNRVFQQHIGIPMGTDCAPLLANLYFLTLGAHAQRGLQ